MFTLTRLGAAPKGFGGSLELRVLVRSKGTHAAPGPAAVAHSKLVAKRTSRAMHHIKIWAEVAKVRLSAMVVLSSGCGFLLAGAPYDIEKLVAVTLGTSLAAASASAFNQTYEKETDGKMLRTRHRPLPAGHVSRAAAASVGVGLGISSLVVLGLGTNAITAGLGALNIFLYSGVYTPMKQKTEWNTWVGALVGAIPPVMGYTAATGTAMAAGPALLGTGLLLWQFPHFFALSWLLRRDYARGGHKMVPCADPTGVRTGKILTNYAVANSVVPFAAYGLGTTTFMFPLESLLFNGYLVYACRKFQNEVSDENARRVFRTSLWYLPVFMGLFVFHSKLDRREDKAAEPMIMWEGTILDTARNYMKDLCLHERILELRTEGAKVPESKDDHPGFCPVTKVEATVDHVNLALDVASKVGGASAK